MGMAFLTSRREVVARVRNAAEPKRFSNRGEISQRRDGHGLSFFEFQIGDDDFGARCQIAEFAGDHNLFGNAGLCRAVLQFRDFFMAFSPTANFTATFTAAHSRRFLKNEVG